MVLILWNASPQGGGVVENFRNSGRPRGSQVAPGRAGIGRSIPGRTENPCPRWILPGVTPRTHCGTSTGNCALSNPRCANPRVAHPARDSGKICRAGAIAWFIASAELVLRFPGGRQTGGSWGCDHNITTACTACYRRS